MEATLDKVADFPALVEYLRDELEWPIAEADFAKLTFSYTPEEVGLDSAKVGGGIEILQLRPLPGLPFGIFFVNLPKKHLSVTLMRTLLGSLAPKKRASSNPAERAVFAQRDLLFIAATGEAGARHIDFAHFRSPEEGARAAPLKVLGWDADDTDRRHRLTSKLVTEKLHWPEQGETDDAWRERWTSAFRDAPRYPITQSKALAEALAALAKRIRDRAIELMAAETEKGPLRKLHAGFKEALIFDLTSDKFADYYAQTITYGLFSARVSRPGGIAQDDVHLNVAGTSPFLKEMLAQFLEAGGRKAGRGGDGLDFDALGVGEVVDLLEAANMDSILADWGHKNQDEDPVVHFYQDFLNLYDPGEKKKRGVFYTPRPVVGFIVRSVDEVLRSEFGLEDGLASTATWGEVIAASKGKEGDEITLPEGAKIGDPFVRILDPATGTGTFLVECIELIHKTMVNKWKAAGKRDAEIKALWNAYVPAHLLPRVTGFELMMAPYAIAHVKLGLKLADTGYTFGSDVRAQIYLTNALERAQDIAAPQFDVMDDALAHESKAANAAKETRFTVVVGNPPYSGKSKNKGPWIEGLMATYKVNVRESEVQIQSLSNDYIKFMRLFQDVIAKTGLGVVSIITSSGYLSGPIFAGVRKSLRDQLPYSFLLDLHGSIRRGSAGDDDENVFDIQQGVSVFVGNSNRGSSAPLLRFGEIIGSRIEKFEALNKGCLKSLCAIDVPALPPSYQFRPMEGGWHDLQFWPLPTIFGTGDPSKDRNKLYSAGFETRQDGFVIAFDDEELLRRIADLSNPALSRADLAARYRMCSTAHFKFDAARARAANGDLARTLKTANYRPFDARRMIWSRFVLCEPQREVTQHIDDGDLCLVASRAVTDAAYAHAFVSRGPYEKIGLSNKTSSNAYMFPLRRKLVGTETRTLPNIAPAFAARIAALTGLAYDDCVEGPKQGALGGILSKKAEQTAMFAPARRERGEPGKSFGPRDLFDYIYAVLHAPAYRERYADYLKSDFARIPLPGSRALFEALVPLGTELVALHLLDADALPILKDPKGLRLAGSGEARVSMAAAKFEDEAFENGRMYISASKSRWFETVPAIAADFHVGGYRPARKWLKDRAAKGGKKASDGRVLTEDDILHYRRMITALTRTAELMPQIDAVVEKHGGWPGAFRGIVDEGEVG